MDWKMRQTKKNDGRKTKKGEMTEERLRKEKNGLKDETNETIWLKKEWTEEWDKWNKNEWRKIKKTETNEEWDKWNKNEWRKRNDWRMRQMKQKRMKKEKRLNKD